jgi:predicted nuclease of predicted toxin-antitoxin system
MAEALQFLADESCDFSVVRALRSEGYDVVAVGDHRSRSIDGEVIDQAAAERRVLLTEDKDFGWLVFVSQAASAGVILIRYPSEARSLLAADVSRFVREQAGAIPGAFAVLQRARSASAVSRPRNHVRGPLSTAGTDLTPGSQPLLSAAHGRRGQRTSGAHGMATAIVR